MYIWQILKINLIYPQGKTYIQNVCVVHVSFLVGGGGQNKKKENLPKCLQFTDENCFKFDVVLSVTSDSTFAMTIITKA